MILLNMINHNYNLESINFKNSKVFIKLIILFIIVKILLFNNKFKSIKNLSIMKLMNKELNVK